jgi:hypothetical protein
VAHRVVSLSGSAVGRLPVTASVHACVVRGQHRGCVGGGVEPSSKGAEERGGAASCQLAEYGAEPVGAQPGGCDRREPNDRRGSSAGRARVHAHTHTHTHTHASTHTREHAHPRECTHTRACTHTERTLQGREASGEAGVQTAAHPRALICAHTHHAPSACRTLIMGLPEPSRSRSNAAPDGRIKSTLKALVPLRPQK